MKRVLVTGGFDLIHKGHVAFLEKASALGEQLFVGLSTDETIRERKGIDRPVYAYEDRSKILRALRSVDAVYPIHGLNEEEIAKSTKELVNEIKPHIIACGWERTADPFMIPLAEKNSWLTYCVIYCEMHHTTDTLKQIRGT